MTERDERNLRVMADPASYSGGMTRAEREAVAAALDEIDRLRDRPVIDPALAEAMSLAAGLCHSEANRMERAHPPTAEHWRSIATRLQGGYLASGGGEDQR
jgi:hypothetical protein